MTNLLFNVDYWFTLGVLNLAMMTYQDYTNNRKVDDRKNYFMYGVTLALLAIVPTNVWYFALILAVIFITNRLIKRVSVLGDGDIKSMSWVILGCSIISPFLLLAYFVIFAISLVTFSLTKKYIVKVNGPLPFYGALLISYICLYVIFKAFFITSL